MSSEGEKKKGGISALAIDHPRGTAALASLLVLLGLLALFGLPVELLPSVDAPRMRVTVEYPGASPEVVEIEITRVLERQLSGLEDLQSMESYAQEGRSGIVLTFVDGADMDRALLNAARSVESARPLLPSDISPTRINRFNPAERPVLELGLTSTARRELEVREWAEDRLLPQVQGVNGVGSVEILGGQVREFHVLLDFALLERENITFEEIGSTLARENFDLAAGEVRSGSLELMARADGRLRNVHDIELLELHRFDGSTLRLGELAEVRDTFQEQRVFVRLNGVGATRIAILKDPEANTVDLVRRLRREIDRLERSGFVPADIIVEPVADQAFFVQAAIGSVRNAALLGAFLAGLVVLFFLGSFRRAFVVILAIPLALLATFALLGATGFSLNIMTLGGMALAIGLLLDNSIVILENIYRHQKELKKSPGQAAVDGCREVLSAVVASTATNLGAILPFLLLTGMAAMIFQDLILTVASAVLVTLLVAITLVPSQAALLSRLKFSSGFHRSFPVQTNQRLMRGARKLYRVLAIRWMKMPGLVLGLTLLVFGGALYSATKLPIQFLPDVDDGNVFVSMQLPRGTTVEETLKRTVELEELIQSQSQVDHIFGVAGGRLSAGTLNPRSGLTRYDIYLAPAAERPDLSARAWVRSLERDLRDLEIPGARFSVQPPRIPGLSFPSGDAPVSLALVGDDLEELGRFARTLIQESESIEGLTGFDIQRDDRTPMLQIDIDRPRASELGLSPATIAQTVRLAVLGTVATEVEAGGRSIDLRLLPATGSLSPDELERLPLSRSNGDWIPLGEVASLRLVDGPTTITRENQLRLLRLEGDIDRDRTDIIAVNQELRQLLVDLELPDSIQPLFGGEEEAIEETRNSLGLAIFLAIFLVYIVLVVQYERLAIPLVILSSTPLALMGVIAMLWATGTALSAPVLLGMILLVGIVANNAILLVEYIELARADGASPFEAVLQAGEIRLRPIVMTSLTTMFGMLPLAIGFGEGSELMQPMAIAVIGGLLVAGPLTLFVIPALFLVLIPRVEKLVKLLSR